MKCTKCGEELIACDPGEIRTLLGYSSPPGHNHDDNCIKKAYWCKNNHMNLLSIRRRCSNPDCDWVGKKDCFCHDGKKLDEWPEVNEIRKEPWW